MHPELPGDVAVVMLVRAALTLQRNGHASGVEISRQVERVASKGSLFWKSARYDYDNAA
jgi:hypothetical protein